MPFHAPLPWSAARQVMASRKILPTSLSAAELEQIDSSLLRGASFSARVTKADFVGRAVDLVNQIVDPLLHPQESGAYMNKAKARELLKEALSAMGYDATAEGVVPGSLRDLSSDGRLNLIIDTNAEMISAQARAVQGNDETVLDAYPCKELVRVSNFSAVSRGTARDWPQRWRDGGGQFYGGGRMIARKDDPVWTDRAFSRFGNPYEPFDYNSGMGTREISRTEAIALGVMAANERAPMPRPLADLIAPALQAGTSALDEATQQALLASLGDGYEIKDGVLGLAGAS